MAKRPRFGRTLGSNFLRWVKGESFNTSRRNICPRVLLMLGMYEVIKRLMIRSECGNQGTHGNAFPRRGSGPIGRSP